MTREDVLAAVKFWRKQATEIWAHILILPFLLIFLVGLTNIPRLAAWSVAALAYAAYVGLTTWTPWDQWVYRVARGTSLGERPTNIQVATERFINAPSRRFKASLLTATAILTPWVAYVINALFGVTQVGRYNSQTALPLWSFLVLGLLDGVRAKTLAIRMWTDAVLSNWNELTSEASYSSIDAHP